MTGQTLRAALYAAWPEIRCKCPNDDPHRADCKVGALVGAVDDAARALDGVVRPFELSPQQREIARLLDKHGSTMAAQVAPWRVRQWEEWFAQRDRTKP